MYPAAFEYHRPKSIADAIALLRDNPQAKLIAGGHSLIPLMKQRLTDLTHLVDLRDVDDLQGIRRDGDHLQIGAMTTHWTVETSPEAKADCAVLLEVAAGIGDPQVRNCGTIGGSLVHADPGADYPAIALAMEAELVCEGTNGRRTVKATDWFHALMTTDIAEDELMVAVRFPVMGARAGAAYIKIPDPASRLAMLGVAAFVQLDDAGACSRIGIGVTGIGSVPGRATTVEKALAGTRLDDRAIADAMQGVVDDIEIETSRTSELEDRQDLCRVVTGRAVRLAAARASQV